MVRMTLSAADMTVCMTQVTVLLAAGTCLQAAHCAVAMSAYFSHVCLLSLQL